MQNVNTKDLTLLIPVTLLIPDLMAAPEPEKKKIGFIARERRSAYKMV
jgi:hypothetical protein